MNPLALPNIFRELSLIEGSILPDAGWITRREAEAALDLSTKLDSMDNLIRLREATSDRTAAETAWRDAVRDAMDATQRAEQGYGVDDVVEAAGVSRPRVYQIVKEGR